MNDTTWYVEPIGSESLSAISIQLSSQEPQVLPVFGERSGRSLLVCPPEKVHELLRLTKERGLNANFFTQRGTEPIKLCQFPEKLKVAM